LPRQPTPAWVGDHFHYAACYLKRISDSLHCTSFPINRAAI